MITIRQENNRITAEGHAGYAPYGQDIVCAAISALLQTFVQSVEELTNCEIKSDLRPGKAVIEYEDETDEGVALLVESFFIGVSGIAAAYPENVEIIREGSAKR